MFRETGRSKVLNPHLYIVVAYMHYITVFQKWAQNLQAVGYITLCKTTVRWSYQPCKLKLPVLSFHLFIFSKCKQKWRFSLLLKWAFAAFALGIKPGILFLVQMSLKLIWVCKEFCNFELSILFNTNPWVGVNYRNIIKSYCNIKHYFLRGRKRDLITGMEL